MENIKNFLSINSGYGYGSGSGDGFGSGIKSINGSEIHQIDDVPTIIKQTKGNVAKGFILEPDLTLTPCYVAKGQDKFAHGKTLREAINELQNKMFSDMDTDEVIKMFLNEFSDLDQKYPAKSFYVWHNRLTGSCEMGRNSFVKSGGYDLENDTFTVREFIEITKNAFGGDVIKQLEQVIEKGDG